MNLNSASPNASSTAPPNNPALPSRTINSEQIKRLIQTAQIKKSQGATEANDPEYSRIMNILRMCSRQPTFRQTPMNLASTPQNNPNSTFINQKVLVANQDHENSAVLTSSTRTSPEVNAPSSSPVNMPSTINATQMKSPITQNEPNTSMVNGINNMNTTASQSMMKPHLFTSNQLQTLKCQIMAYKFISKNIPLPPNLKKIFFPQNPPSDLIKKEASEQSTPLNDSNQQSDKSSIHVASEEPELSSTSSNDERVLYERNIEKYQPLIIPSITPLGLDPKNIIEERNREIRSRIQHRIQELETLPSNLSENNLEYNDTEDDGESKSNLKMKALIELKALQLIEKQKKLREEILQGYNRSTTLVTAIDRTPFKRIKKQTLREARITERIERQQKAERERKEKQKHLEYIQSILNHGREMFLWHKNHQSKMTKLGKAVFQYHTFVEREEQKRLERLSRERLKALKADDEEAYLKLIDQEKDTRITHLLKQTDSFLESLSVAVLQQQNDISHNDPSVRGGEELMDDMNVAFEDDEDKKMDYYTISHRIQEKVIEQPKILTGGTLKDYQVKGLQWMVSLYNNRLNGILADEMGLGKTIQTISFVTFLIEKKKQNGPFLIIVPLSTIDNWTLEFEKWAPTVSKVVYKGTPIVRKQIQQNEIKHGNFQVLLTTYDYIIKDRPLLSKIKWVLMIIDEGHRMKNTNSKLVSNLTQYYSSRYRLILTGTPLQNNLPELWALLNFILPRVFNSVKTFDDWFNTPFANSGGQDKIELNEEEKLLIIKRLHKILRPFILRRLKKDVESELPDKVERVIKCKMSALQNRLYQQLRKNGMLLTRVEEKGRTGIKGLNNTIIQLRKICNHPFVFDEVENVINPARLNTEILYRVSGKFELLDRILPKLFQTGHKVLIFFQMTTVMSIMEDFLHFRGFRYLRLDGSTKAEERAEYLKKFNHPESPYFIFLLSTRAGGLGLNLQTADTVIIFDSDWNPHQDLQAQDRAHRIGQKNEVRILRLITEKSVEEHILARAQWKLDIDGKVIQAGKFDNKSTAEEREAFLRSLLELGNDEPNDVEDEEEFNDEELNDILSRNDQEMTLFKEIDRKRIEEETQMWRERNVFPLPERLIQDHELPDLYLQDYDPSTAKQNELNLERHQRNRAEVRYDDGLTEEQFINALEDDEVDLQELVRQKQERRRRREERLRMKQSQTEHEGSPEANDNFTPRKRGRPRKTDDDDGLRRSGKRRKTLDGDDELPYSSKSGKLDPLPPEERQRIKEIMEQCYQAVENCVDAEDGNRPRCILFLELPSKKQYPEYYAIIKKPIAMNIIRRRIKNHHYLNLEQFKEDFHLMFNNARIFNEDGSLVYIDACKLQEAFDSQLHELSGREAPTPAPV